LSSLAAPDFGSFPGSRLLRRGPGSHPAKPAHALNFALGYTGAYLLQTQLRPDANNDNKFKGKPRERIEEGYGPAGRCNGYL
jgi:hypothetical protein